MSKVSRACSRVIHVSSHYRTALKLPELRQQKKLNKLTQKNPAAKPTVSPPVLQAPLALHRGRAEDKPYLKARAVPGNHSRSLEMWKTSIYFQGGWKVSAPEHRMVLVFHWTAQRELSDEALLMSCCWCVWICTFPSVFLHLKNNLKEKKRERSSLWKPLLPLLGGECVVNMSNFFFLPIPIISLHSPSHLQL